MTEVKKEEPRKKNIFKKLLMLSIAISFWTYTISKLFIFDIDVYLINTWFQSAVWLIDFKFPILLGSLALFWLFSKNATILTWILYVLLFPFILLIWKIPRIIVRSKSWVAAFTYISMLIAFFRSIKANTIGFASIVIPTILIWKCQNPVVLWISFGLISIFILFLFSRAIYFAFKPSLLFRIQAKVVEKFWDTFKAQCLPDNDIKDIVLPQMNEKQIEKWTTNLQNAVIVNRTCYFLSTKLQDFQKSKINIAFYLTNYFFVVILTIFSFSLLNFAIYKVDPLSFSVAFSPRFYHFLYYSANTLFTNGIPDFYALSNLARGIGTIEVILAVVLLGILFFLLTTVVTDRHNEDIDFAIKSMRKQGEYLDELIKEHYRLSVEEAVLELERLKASFMKAILYLSANINRT